jgi:hypothetical protein
MKGYIYKIEVEGELLYVGSTKQKLTKRKGQHKSFCFQEKHKNRKFYKKLKEEYNITKENFNEMVSILWICDIEYEERHELRAVETEYIKKLNPHCNCYIPYGKEWDVKEYKKDNKETIKKYQKKHYDNNKETIKKTQKEWRDNNKETIKKKTKRMER